MSSFYDDASLVVIPSGYKTSKVYAEKPTDGSGDLAFTRTGDTATRVNSAGIIEKVRTNVLTFSQDFSNASWLVDPLLTRTLNQTDPNGGTTAALYTATSGTNLTFGKNVTLVANAPNTVSIWIKGNASGSVSLRIDDSTLGTQTNINYTTSWQRFSVTRTVNQASCQFVVGGFSTWGTGENLSFAFAQAEAGDIMTDYIPTTSAAVSVGPVANVPRLDYLGSSCPKLLLEPQRTNSVLYSEQFENGVWARYATGTLTTNAAISPDGTLNADLFVPNTTNYQHSIEQNMGTTSGTITMSVYAKASGYNWLIFNAYVGGVKNTFFDLQNGVIGTIASGVTASIQSAGNGWYRIICTVTGGANTYISFSPTTANNVVSFAGNGTSGTLLWGAQLEAGAYATSYIPTLAASATRGADAASKTGISSLIGQTEGTLYAEANIRANKDSVRALQASDGTVDNRIQLAFIGNNFSPAIVTGGVVQAGISVPFTAGNNKFAIAYANNDVVAYLNGVQVLVDNSATIPTCSVLDVGQSLTANTNTLGDPISQALLFKTRLSNASLAELTSL